MSQWGFPTVRVNKPHSNKMRMCYDVRKLNDKTILQPYPMLNMNYLLADIGKITSVISTSFTSTPVTSSFDPTPCSSMSSNVREILEATHCDDRSRPPGMVSCDSAQVLHTPATLKYKSSSSTNQKVLPRKHVRNIPKKTIRTVKNPL